MLNINDEIETIREIAQRLKRKAHAYFEIGNKIMYSEFSLMYEQLLDSCDNIKEKRI